MCVWGLLKTNLSRESERAFFRLLPWSLAFVRWGVGGRRGEEAVPKNGS